MKNRLHNRFVILNYLFSSERFRLSYFLTIILVLYGTLVLGQGAKSFYDIPLISFQFPIFNIFLFSILLLNTISICSIFESDFDAYLIRYRSKKKALKELIGFCILYQLIYYLILFLLFFAFCLILNMNMFSISSYQNYSVSNFSYMIFYLGRYVVFSILISIVNVILYQKLKNQIIYINFLFFLGFFLSFLALSVKKWYSILPWNYFTGSLYSSFSIELLSSFLFMILLIVIPIGYMYWVFKKKDNSCR